MEDCQVEYGIHGLTVSIKKENLVAYVRIVIAELRVEHPDHFGAKLLLRFAECGLAIQFGLDDEPDGRRKDNPEQKYDPAIERFRTDFLKKLGIFVVGIERAKRDEQQHCP